LLYDVDNNGFLNATDALLVINFLRRRGDVGSGSGEGEGEGESWDEVLDARWNSEEPKSSTRDFASYAESIELGLIDLLAEDHHRRRRSILTA
jgi:hypothetical protein